MTKEVLVNISGLQTDLNEVESSDDEPIEVLSPGNYFFKNGKHYIFLEEVTEGIPGVTKTQIKITGKEAVEVIKRGVSNTHMIFEISKRHHSDYQTPYGQFQVGVFTKNIRLDEEDDFMNVEIEYALDVNDEPLAQCCIKIGVQSKKILSSVE